MGTKSTENFKSINENVPAGIIQTSSKIWIGLGSSYALSALVPEKRRLQDISPVAAMKAVKNAVEVKGMRNCHIRDGVALCQYFSWLERTVQAGVEHVDEISGATYLENLRKKQDKFMGLSFTTISASGPNGSVIHYHPAQSTNRSITTNEIYLCDSGAQYLDGTTDVTRTWHFGKPSYFQIECNTRVLKGQMSLGSAVFPNKVKGQVLDTLARKALWDVGLDYGHGTGHGIGHFLNVHEGPMGISYKPYPDDPGLQENMFVSNEPGFYEDGEFGIRIEDIVQIVPANVEHNFSGRGALTFETVTMCPIQTKLINASLLSDCEKSYLNKYHEKVWNTLAPLLVIAEDNLTLDWLKKETAPI